MNFGDMKTLVQTTVKRPDKAAAIGNAINRAIELYTKAANWSDDLVELDVAIDSTVYAQSFSIAAKLASFRKILYIRPTYLDSSYKKKYLRFLTPDRIFQPDGTETLNTWYRSGDNIVFKLAALADTLKVGYYRYYPTLINIGDTHWMLDKATYMIHDKACAAIFTDIGNDEEGRKYEAYAQQAFIAAETDFADGVDRQSAAGNW